MAAIWFRRAHRPRWLPSRTSRTRGSSRRRTTSIEPSLEPSSTSSSSQSWCVCANTERTAAARERWAFRNGIPMVTDTRSLTLRASARDAVEVVARVADAGPVVGRGVDARLGGTGRVALGVVHQLLDLVPHPGRIPDRAAGPPARRTPLPGAARVAGDPRLAPRLRLDGRHAEHLVDAGRHHEDVGEVVDRIEAPLLDRAQGETPDLLDAPDPSVRIVRQAELPDRSRDDQPHVAAPLAERPGRPQQHVAPLLLAHSAHVEHHLPLDAELLALAGGRLRIGPELLGVDPVVEDPQLARGKAPEALRLLQAIAGARQQQVEGAKHALVQVIERRPAPAPELEEVVREHLPGAQRLAHPRAFGLAVEVQHVGGALLQRAHDVVLELEVPERQSRPA